MLVIFKYIYTRKTKGLARDWNVHVGSVYIKSKQVKCNSDKVHP